MDLKPFQPGCLTRDALICLGVIVLASFMLGFNPTIVFFSLFGILLVTSRFDAKARIESTISALEFSGFIPCEITDVDPEFVESLRCAKSTRLRIKNIKSWSIGTVNDREIVLFIVKVPTDNDHEFHAGCGAWSKFHWPRTTIREPNGFFDRFIKAKKIGDSIFDKSRRVITDDSQLMHPVFAAVAGELPEMDNAHKSFRMSNGTETKEQWIINGNWVCVFDNGSIEAENFLDMSDFLTKFVEHMELQIPEP